MENPGVFAVYQPIYAKRGTATFPLRDNKVPTISNYQKIGLPASSQLALKHRFRSANDFGFMTSARTRITVLDVDTIDEHVLADAMIRHGSTPVVARTASGKFHAYYRHNGEHRKIRPFNDLPIDLLGNRGYVVASPSRLEKGAYSFLQGSLDDLDRIPAMRGLDSDMYSRASQIPARPVPCQEAPPVAEGRRDDILWRYCMAMLAEFPNIGR
jgi:Bifunctional DNA primase/polymerase, N-terminal